MCPTAHIRAGNTGNVLLTKYFYQCTTEQEFNKMHHCAALRTRRIICLTCVQPHIPKSMGKLKDGHRIFNLTRQMKGKPCSCHISLTGTLTVSYCLVSYTKDQAWLSNFRICITMRTNLLNWCNLVSISSNVVFYAFLVIRIY